MPEKTTKTTKTKKEELTVETLQKMPSGMREYVAYACGIGIKIGDVIDTILDYYKETYKYTKDLNEKEAKSILRESIRTCNPNDKKFCYKKYGATYREGRLSYVRSMGDDLLKAFERHIGNLNFALEKTGFNFHEGLTIKEYASITKDIAEAVSLYQSLAEAHQPDTEATFDILPALDSQLILAQIEAADNQTQKALPTTSEAPKALPDTSKSNDSE